MSTYGAKSKSGNHQIILGWDPAFNTYFGHVIDSAKDEDDEGRDVVWVGCSPNEIHDIEILAALLRPYYFIDEDMWSNLYRDANA